MTVVGEAGIGKSRLVAEVRRETASLDLRWVEGRCLSYGASMAYLLWLDVVRGLLDMTKEDAPSTLAGMLQEQLQSVCPDLSEKVYPYLARLLSLPLSVEEEALLRAMEGEALRRATFGAVEILIECHARQQPLVLVCEDLHWADSTSLELLEQLLALTERASVLLLCVFRPHTEHGCWQVREAATHLYRHRHTDLWLDPLSGDESTALVGNLLSTEALPPDLVDLALDHAQGNPFYVEEIIRSLIDGDVITYDEATGSWQAAMEVADIAIPDTLQGVLMARIDRLEEGAKRVLQTASVIGRIFPQAVLMAIAHEEMALDEQLLTLQREEMVRERARLPEMEYIFKHHLTQEAAYSGLLRRERRRLHRQVAEATEDLFADRIEEQLGLLAHHWEQAEEAEKAVEYLLGAGDQARLAYANEEAIGYYERALGLCGEHPTSRPEKVRRLEALSGLGQVHFGMGDIVPAEECFRETAALGREIGLPPRELVRLYFWLTEVLYWQGRYDEQIRVAEEGLALLGDDAESVEAVLMTGAIAIGIGLKGDPARRHELTYSIEPLVERLPYSEVLRPAHDFLVEAHMADKHIEETTRWLQIYQERAAAHHDLRALAEAYDRAAYLLMCTGNLRAAISEYQKPLDLCTRIGDLKHLPFNAMCDTLLYAGDLETAMQYAQRDLENAKVLGTHRDLADAYESWGKILLCQGRWEETADAFQKAIHLYGEIGLRALVYTLIALGWTCLAQGKRQEATRHFQEAADWPLFPTARLRPPFADALSGLDEACDDPQAFCAYCRSLWDNRPDARSSPFVQWFLEPTEPASADRSAYIHEGFDGLLSADWAWHDPFGDCAYAVQDGLEIRAANARDLWHLNLSAPRILRPLPPTTRDSEKGDFAAQAVCNAAFDDRPAIGGILLWRDNRNYLRLDRGTRGQHHVSLEGRIENRDLVIGRGRLPAERLFLRLERLGSRVRALCSADGKSWFTVGQVEFSVEGPLQVGLHATGNIDRTIYHGAFPEGTAIRFESFQLWGARRV